MQFLLKLPNDTLEIRKILDPSLPIKCQGKRLHAKVGNRPPALKAPCAILLKTLAIITHSFLDQPLGWKTVRPDLDLFAFGLIFSVILKFLIALIAYISVADLKVC